MPSKICCAVIITTDPRSTNQKPERPKANSPCIAQVEGPTFPTRHAPHCGVPTAAASDTSDRLTAIDHTDESNLALNELVEKFTQYSPGVLPGCCAIDRGRRAMRKSSTREHASLNEKIEPRNLYDKKNRKEHSDGHDIRHEGAFLVQSFRFLSH